MPVNAAGMDLGGHSFLADCHSELITPAGCTIVLREALMVDDVMDLRVADRDVRGRVAGKIKTLPEGHVYAIEFDPESNFHWDTCFPLAAQPAPAVSLYCSACDLPGETALMHLDALVYEATGAITRACPRCREGTKWTPARSVSRPRTQMSQPAPCEAQGQTTAVVPIATYIEQSPSKLRTKNERKSARVLMRAAKACVETPVRGTEVVAVIDISKGGLRFASFKRYERGDWMKVAVPYTAGGNNIFVGAEIVRVQKATAEGLPNEYAVRFRPTERPALAPRRFQP